MTSPSIGSSPSSKAQVEKSVHRLNSEESLRQRSNKSNSLQYKSCQQPHVSSASAFRRKLPYEASTIALQHVLEEPDFGTEERSVWSNRSPVNRASVKKALDVDPEDAVESSNFYAGRQTHLRDLQPKIVVSSDHDERPKTRRGPSGPSAFESISSSGVQESVNRNNLSARQAKFVEGTMSTKSKAVASTWSDFDYATSSSEAEETDSEATPKAARERRSGSFDLRDFQPPILTPSAIKRTLFRRREGKVGKKSKNGDRITNGEQTDDDGAQKPRKRLRKSMSKLHFLGEKMKIFGSSSQDLSEQAGRETPHKKQDDQVTLDERKRKAESAYAEQFGTKKQKDNTGSGNIARRGDEATNQQESYGNQKYDSSTVRGRGSTMKARRISTGSIFSDENTKDSFAMNDHDIKRRPSRRELEEENEKLRALLKESQATHEQAAVYTSETEPIPPIPPLRIRRNSTSSFEGQPPHLDSSLLDQNSCGLPVPPLPPQHPDRRALANVSNRRTNRARRQSFGVVSDNDGKEKVSTNDTSNPLSNAPRLVPTPSERSKSLSPRRSLSTLPSPFSMIVEEPENEIDEKKRSLRSRHVSVGKENALSATPLNVASSGTKEEWQWPDDVF